LLPAGSPEAVDPAGSPAAVNPAGSPAQTAAVGADGSTAQGSGGIPFLGGQGETTQQSVNLLHKIEDVIAQTSDAQQSAQPGGRGGADDAALRKLIETLGGTGKHLISLLQKRDGTPITVEAYILTLDESGLKLTELEKTYLTQAREADKATADYIREIHSLFSSLYELASEALQKFENGVNEKFEQLHPNFSVIEQQLQESELILGQPLDLLVHPELETLNPELHQVLNKYQVLKDIFQKIHLLPADSSPRRRRTSKVLEQLTLATQSFQELARNFVGLTQERVEPQGLPSPSGSPAVSPFQASSSSALVPVGTAVAVATQTQAENQVSAVTPLPDVLQRRPSAPDFEAQGDESIVEDSLDKSVPFELSVSKSFGNLNLGRNRVLFDGKVSLGFLEIPSFSLESLKNAFYVKFFVAPHFILSVNEFGPSAVVADGRGEHFTFAFQVKQWRALFEKGQTNGIPFSRANFGVLSSYQDFLGQKVAVGGGIGSYWKINPKLSESQPLLFQLLALPKKLVSVPGSFLKKIKEDDWFAFAEVDSVTKKKFVNFDLNGQIHLKLWRNPNIKEPVSFQEKLVEVSKSPDGSFGLQKPPTSSRLFPEIPNSMNSNGENQIEQFKVFLKESLKNQSDFLVSSEKRLSGNLLEMGSFLIGENRKTAENVTTSVKQALNDQTEILQAKNAQMLDEFFKSSNPVPLSSSSSSLEFQKALKMLANHEEKGDFLKTIGDFFQSSFLLFAIQWTFEGLLLGFSAGTAYIVRYQLQYSTTQAEVKLSARVGRLALSRLVSFGYYSAVAIAAFNVGFNKITGKPLTEKFAFLSSLLHFGVTLLSQFLSKKEVLETQKSESNLARMGLTVIDVSLVAFFANAFFNVIKNQNSLLGCLGVFCKFIIGVIPYSFMIKFFHVWVLNDQQMKTLMKNETTNSFSTEKEKK
jgi:hypothetical protein